MNNAKNCPHCNKTIKLLGHKEIAEILCWDPRRVSTYRKRGHIPEPDFELSAGPVWFADNAQLQEFINKHKEGK